MQRRWPSVVVAALGVVVVSDNAGFLATSSVHARDYGFGLNATERSAFNAISKLDPPRVLLTDDERLGYLAAVYTPARPWFGHKYNTPRFDDRKRLAGQLAQGSDAQIPPDVDVILTQSAPFCTRLYAEGWSEIGRFDALVLWRRSAGFDRLAHGSTD